MFDFFKNRFNKIARFNKIGLLSTINVNQPNLDKLNIHLKKENTKKIIAIFDNSVGPQRWYNENDYLNLISFIKEISLNKNYKIIFKTKTNLELFKNRGFSNNLYLKLKELLINKNILYANDYEFSSIDIIKSSDICIACPFSTVIFECSYFNKPVFGFDPSLNFVKTSDELGLSYFKDIYDFNKNILNKIDHKRIINKKINQLINLKNYKIENLNRDLKDIINFTNV
jgi:hypothetical protein